MLHRLREPANGATHGIGVILSVAALGVLLWLGWRGGSVALFVGFAVFGLSQLTLYIASTLYHSLRISEAGIRQLLRFDCAMVFVFIAGTYTPVCLVALEGGWRWGLLALIWGLALGGGAMKLRWLHAPVWLSTGFYVLMGWVAVLALPALVRAVPPGGIFWMFAGGIIYTVGAVIFALDRPALVPGVFEAHALWHLFVLAGSACFFWMMVRYIAPLAG